MFQPPAMQKLQRLLAGWGVSPWLACWSLGYDFAYGEAGGAWIQEKTGTRKL